MKKEYKEPKIVIELFPGQDVIACSDWGGEGGGEEGEGTLGGARVGSDDA